jgi:hypothetical protein
VGGPLRGQMLAHYCACRTHSDRHRHRHTLASRIGTGGKRCTSSMSTETPTGGEGPVQGIPAGGTDRHTHTRSAHMHITHIHTHTYVSTQAPATAQRPKNMRKRCPRINRSAASKPARSPSAAGGPRQVLLLQPLPALAAACCIWSRCHAPGWVCKRVCQPAVSREVTHWMQQHTHTHHWAASTPQWQGSRVQHAGAGRTDRDTSNTKQREKATHTCHQASKPARKQRGKFKHVFCCFLGGEGGQCRPNTHY